MSLDVFFFFFFQAEDGIRDRDVTGVQTCALPIFAAPEAADGVARLDDFRDELVSERKRPAERHAPVNDRVIQVARRHDERRSEERRVGKEGRSGRAAHRYKKKSKEKGSGIGGV